MAKGLLRKRVILSLLMAATVTLGTTVAYADGNEGSVETQPSISNPSIYGVLSDEMGHWSDIHKNIYDVPDVTVHDNYGDRSRIDKAWPKERYDNGPIVHILDKKRLNTIVLPYYETDNDPFIVYSMVVGNESQTIANQIKNIPDSDIDKVFAEAIKKDSSKGINGAGYVELNSYFAVDSSNGFSYPLEGGDIVVNGIFEINHGAYIYAHKLYTPVLKFGERIKPSSSDETKIRSWGGTDYVSHIVGLQENIDRLFVENNNYVVVDTSYGEINKAVIQGDHVKLASAILGDSLYVNDGATAILYKPWKHVHLDKQGSKLVLNNVGEGIEDIESQGTGSVSNSGALVEVYGVAVMPKNVDPLVKVKVNPSASIVANASQLVNMQGNHVLNKKDNIMIDDSANIVLLDPSITADELKKIEGLYFTPTSVGKIYTLKKNNNGESTAYSIRDIHDILEHIKYKPSADSVNDISGVGAFDKFTGVYAQDFLQKQLVDFLPVYVDKKSVKTLSILNYGRRDSSGEDSNILEHHMYDDSTENAVSSSIKAQSLDLNQASKLLIDDKGILALRGYKESSPSQFITGAHGKDIEVVLGSKDSAIKAPDGDRPETGLSARNMSGTTIPLGVDAVSIYPGSFIQLQGVSLDTLQGVDVDQAQRNTSVILGDNVKLNTVNLGNTARIRLAPTAVGGQLEVNHLHTSGIVYVENGKSVINDLNIKGKDSTNTGKAFLARDSVLQAKHIGLENTNPFRIFGAKVIAKNDLDGVGHAQSSLDMDENSYIIVAYNGQLDADVQDLHGGNIFVDPDYGVHPSYLNLNILPKANNDESTRTLTARISVGQNAVAAIGDGSGGKDIEAILNKLTEFAIDNPKYNEQRKATDPVYVGNMAYITSPIDIDNSHGLLLVDPSLEYNSHRVPPREYNPYNANVSPVQFAYDYPHKIETPPQTPPTGTVKVAKDGLLFFDVRHHDPKISFIKAKKAILDAGSHILVLHAKDNIRYSLITADEPVVGDVSKVLGSIQRKGYNVFVNESDDKKTVYLLAVPIPGEAVEDVDDDTDSTSGESTPKSDLAYALAIGGVQANSMSASRVLTGALDAPDVALSKDLWARYVHDSSSLSNKTLDDGVTVTDGQTKRDSVVVGHTFTNRKGHNIGIAASYMKGADTVGRTAMTAVNDKDKYYGFALYDHYDRGPVSLVGDVSYTHGQHELGILSDKKAYKDKLSSGVLSIGLKAERTHHLASGAAVTPYVGLRYAAVRTGDFKVTGLSIASQQQNVLSLPVGLKYGLSKHHGQWTVQPTAQVGYQWNLSGRDVQMKSTVGDKTVDVKASVLPKGFFEGKLGLVMSNGKNSYSLYYSYADGNGEHSKQVAAQAKFSF